MLSVPVYRKRIPAADAVSADRGLYRHSATTFRDDSIERKFVAL